MNSTVLVAILATSYLPSEVMVNSCLVVFKRHEIEKIGCHFGFTVDHNNQRVVADFQSFNGLIKIVKKFSFFQLL